MFSHVVVGANDLEAAKEFYDTLMDSLGHEPGTPAGDRVIYSSESGILVVTRPFDGNGATNGNGITIGLNAPGRDAIDAFHRRGIEAGGTDAGEPGARAAIPNSYAAYLRDPVGNKLVAWCILPEGGE